MAITNHTNKLLFLLLGLLVLVPLVRRAPSFELPEIHLNDVYSYLPFGSDLDDYAEEVRSYQDLLSDANSTVEPAPRTFLGDYNVLDDKKHGCELFTFARVKSYGLIIKDFLYSPSGGIGNQMVELASGCHIARVLNRTLLVPMLGSHSSLWYAYEKLSPNALFPMDRVLDFPHLSRYCAVRPLNVSVKGFAEIHSHPKSNMFTIFHHERMFWKIDDLVNAVKAHLTTPVIYLHGAEMYHRWFSPRRYDKVMHFIRFSPYLRWRAMEITKQAFPPDGRFNAMHIRLGDYSERWPEELVEKANAIANRPRHAHLENPDLPLYIATDEPRCKCLYRIRRQRPVKTIDELPRKLVRDFGNMFSRRFRLDMEGVLDQLICSQANDFIPITWSTFSQGILRIRKNKDHLFPELKGRFNRTSV